MPFVPACQTSQRRALYRAAMEATAEAVAGGLGSPWFTLVHLRFVGGACQQDRAVAGQAARRVVEQTNEEGMTPLMIAARSGCFETFELLLQARAPAPAPASSPHHHAYTRMPWCAAQHGRGAVAALTAVVHLGSPGCTQYGAQDICRDVDGRQAYHHA
jgi:hypothetical protein